MEDEITYQKIRPLGVQPDAYAKVFSRPVYSTISNLDADEPFFSEDERLSAYEFGEVENWPDQLVLLLTRKLEPIFDQERSFIECAAGDKPPKTLHEQIIVKLVFQALALGGLFYADEELEGFFYSDAEIQNDIHQLSSNLLRKFLRSIGEELSRRKSTEPEVSKEEQEQMREEDEEYERLLADLGSDSDDYGRSSEEGWFYPDSREDQD